MSKNHDFKKKEKLFLTFFFIAILIIKLPPLYLFFTTSKLLSSHTIAKIILICLMAFFFANFKSKNIFLKKSIFFTITFYLFTSSLSVITANDVLLFLKDYHSLIMSLLLFIISFYVGSEFKYRVKMNKFIIFCGFIIVFFDLIFYLFTPEFMLLGKYFFQREIITLYTFNLQRSRYNLYLNSELFLPFFINLFILENKNKNERILGLFGVFLIIFFTFVSNFRHRFLFLILVISFYSFFILIKKPNINQYLLKILSTIIVFGVLISFLFVRTFSQKDIINRILLNDEREDIGSINSRIDNFYRSVDLFWSSPIFGVGLGNYQLYAKNKKIFIFDKLSKDFYSDSIRETHSIISKTIGETGYIGLVGLLTMMTFFIIRDFVFIKKGISINTFAYITVYWAFFILSLITPSTTLFRAGWMWLMRGILEGQYYLSEMNQRNNS